MERLIERARKLAKLRNNAYAPWKQAGSRWITPNVRMRVKVINVSHEHGRWNVIFCKTSEIADLAAAAPDMAHLCWTRWPTGLRKSKVLSGRSARSCASDCHDTTHNVWRTSWRSSA